MPRGEVRVEDEDNAALIKGPDHQAFCVLQNMMLPINTVQSQPKVQNVGKSSLRSYAISRLRNVLLLKRFHLPAQKCT
jgi:hypothetical protein